MRGRDVLWQPGTDHAGIATQMVVERQLMERQEPGRRDMGREKFLERVWAVEGRDRRHHHQPAEAARRLLRLVARALHHGRGAVARRASRCSSSSTAQGLIYKDKRLVNWDPKLLTAISDLEVEQVEVKGHLWHLRYPLEGITFDPDDPRLHRRRDHAAGDHAGRHRGRGASGRRALQASDRQARRSCRWSAAAFRSSPTNIPIRRRAPAR